MAFCEKCGTELLRGAKVCDRCGHPVSGRAQPDPQQARRPRRSAGADSSDRALLRALSVAFAVALILFLAGIGGRIYIGRVVDFADNRIVADAEYSGPEYRSYFIRETAAAARGDARVYLNTIRDRIRKADPDDLLGLDFEIDREAVQEAKELLREVNQTGRDNYGARWILFQAAGWYMIGIWIFGILSAFLLVFWFMKGGSFRRFKETVSPAAWIMVLGLILLAVCCFISPDFSKSV